MGFSLPSDPSPGSSDGAQPDEGPEQIARPRNQEDEFPFQEVAPFPQLPCRFRFKYFLKPSMLHVEACLLEKIFGPNRALLPAFEREFKVLLQIGDPDPEGKVEINILGSHWYKKRAKRLIHTWTAKSQRKRYGGAVMFNLETMKYVERENVHSSAFSATVMRRLDEAMQSLKIGQETVQEPVPKTI
ncbi:oocyte-expressed protein homolog [Pteropus alecto]|uniref:oocyte-expressed protein homolog n=1 Tax=Pteropus alecto TaxID=9402 RepID=UPI000D538553|nr:oocyte-expressed protein homolog [Pteropus alecto]